MLAITRQTVRDQRGVAYGVREKWQTQGMLTGSSPEDLRAKIAALEQAYAVDGLDVVLLMPNGAPSTHAIISANTLGGVRITDRPSFPSGGGAEYCTIRRYTIGLEAVWPTAGKPADPVLLAFSETIRFTGGGPRYDYHEPPQGRPIGELLKQQTVWRGTQSGQARGINGIPVVPLPLWPSYQTSDPDYSLTATETPEGTEYQVGWTYQFAANIKLSGKPHRWGSIKK
jgi:hypothetical protein